MKFLIEKTSNYEDCQVKEFNTLQDLLDFLEECGEEIILRKSYRPHNTISNDCKYTLEIYDAYRE